MRGATTPSTATGSNAAISIHAPLAGCDPSVLRRPRLFRHFNPRTPCGVRPFVSLAEKGDIDISIHAPLAGCDGPRCGRKSETRPFQSTHPLRGATIKDVKGYEGLYNFNPRTPCGVRRISPQISMFASSFQSTHPLRGATVSSVMPCNASIFQSTHPLRGATTHKSIAKEVTIFQSTHPLRGATSALLITPIDTSFQSTHPLRGATWLWLLISYFCSHFNPRTPCGVRLCHFPPKPLHTVISIHAPLAGCDP